MRSHVDWIGEQNILYKGVKTSHNRRVLKTLRESPKRTISISSGRELLQLVSEPDTEWCACDDAEP